MRHMRQIALTALVAAMIALALPLAALAAEAPEYPGATIDGKWESMNGSRVFDVKAGKSILTSIEGAQDETTLHIVSDDGKTVEFTEDGAPYVAEKNADGALIVNPKGKSTFPITLKKAK